MHACWGLGSCICLMYICASCKVLCRCQCQLCRIAPLLISSIASSNCSRQKSERLQLLYQQHLIADKENQWIPAISDLHYRICAPKLAPAQALAHLTCDLEDHSKSVCILHLCICALHVQTSWCQASPQLIIAVLRAPA